ncbi:MAG: polysaccharide deacetylase family protein [Solirubrobacterales bacterium]|nr:polysaccharide deacetylase family protein [Solirubrobacterales bacterium]
MARTPEQPRARNEDQPPTGDRPERTLLLSVDFEDWHQLVRRRVSASGWQQPGPALARQTNALLDLLDELHARATFFVLGMAARTHPDLLEAVVARGHEIGCHGDAHLPVLGQTPQEFAADLRAARSTIEQLTGSRPIGYRAPAFSIPRDARWAYEVLEAEGFAYDSSQHESPAGRGADVAPYELELPNGQTLWELPVAVWSAGRANLRVGGASYWSIAPRRLVLHGLSRAGRLAGLYLHPHELDPQPLEPLLPPGTGVPQRAQARLRALQRNAARRRAAAVLRTIAQRFRLISYGEGHATLSAGSGTRPRALS